MFVLILSLSSMCGYLFEANSWFRHFKSNDFRASGSGIIEWAPKKIDQRCVKIALDVSQRLGAQSLAFDFIYDLKKEPLMVEIS